ncbi:MAG: hypothetical protein JO051_03405 [Acidobacteriaceae bacterium]|nr:hypothetical protein [Acidobacteriaceae bacterium]
MVDNPRPAHERLSAFVKLYFKGSPEQKDADGNVTSPEQPAEVVEMLPVDAKEAIARDPDLWTYDIPEEDGDDPGAESRQSAHGNTPEEIYANDAATSMRKDGYAAEPAGSRAGRRPGAYSPSRFPRRSPTTIVDPAKDSTTGTGKGNDPKSGDTNIAANRRRSSSDTADADLS